MKGRRQNLRTYALALFWMACSREIQTEDLRTPVAAEESADLGNADGVARSIWQGLPWQEITNPEMTRAEFLRNTILVNKIEPDQLVIFGRDGVSWVSSDGADGALRRLEPAIVIPDGSQLLTLPRGEFWLLSEGEIGRRKAVNTGDGVVRLERISTETFLGDRSKMKVLFASETELVLSLGTHLGFLTFSPDEISLQQIEIQKLPIALPGPIQAAGKAGDGAYWISVKDLFLVLRFKDQALSWQALKIPMRGFTNYSQLAMWINLDKNAPLGDAMLFQTSKLWSLSGGPGSAK